MGIGLVNPTFKGSVIVSAYKNLILHPLLPLVENCILEPCITEWKSCYFPLLMRVICLPCNFPVRED